MKGKKVKMPAPAPLIPKVWNDCEKRRRFMHPSFFITTYSEEAEQYERGASVPSASREVISNCDWKAKIPK